MRFKKMKRLLLSKNTISNLQEMDAVNGGVITNPNSLALPGGSSCELPCNNPTYTCNPRSCVRPTTDNTIGMDLCGFCPAI